MKLLIKNGTVIRRGNEATEMIDILSEDGIITELGKSINSEDAEVIDASGKIVIPGLIDAHCHLREPGFEYMEDIESGTKSAASGGFTSIACMPNTKPVTDNEAVVDYIKARAKEVGTVNVFPIGAISKGLEGKELAEIGELKTAGAVGISDDGKPVMDPSLMKKAMQYSSMFDIRVISHCEDILLTEDGVMNEGYNSTLLGLKGIPAAAEEVMVAREIILSQYTDVPVHIAHVSTEVSVDMIRTAKKNNIRVTAETCPHYFTLTEEMCRGYNTNAKINPPLRTQEDVEAVIEGLKDGTIDIIVTDHAPHHIDEKNVEFNVAANGIIGFETAFALAYTYLVKPGHISLSELVYKMTLRPSEILGLARGAIEIGKPADITVIDTGTEYEIDISKFKSKSRNSPFNGFKVFGKICHVAVNGKIVVKDGELA